MIDQAPLNYLQAFGIKADKVVPLIWGLAVISIIVVVIVSVLVLVGALRRGRAFSPNPDAMPPVERAGSGLPWITIGVGLSTLVLIAAMVWTVATMAAINRPSRQPDLTIEVRAHQWWWEARYLSGDPSRIFRTANEIHIPVGPPVKINLASSDVIHSFWVPAIGGKLDAIPGQTNATWLEARKPGTYRGQCTEYCGLQHARMGFVVVAEPPDEFRAWWDSQLRAQASSGPHDGLAGGRQLFVQRCGACHTVRGTQAGGIMGPDLTHVMSRGTIAAGTLPNTTANLAGWIANPQTIKPGSLMPNIGLSGPELASIRAYVETLK
ncbi:MAG TPA: cytochrome c oxidase subunit II [Ferrovibrio sp.]|uniref:cytochrome c oxidase subunit II n=1 Tax=Ferrovibrio sp. TaxID=1917215 RepID=UPI002ED30B36